MRRLQRLLGVFELMRRWLRVVIWLMRRLLEAVWRQLSRLGHAQRLLSIIFSILLLFLFPLLFFLLACLDLQPLISSSLLL